MFNVSCIELTSDNFEYVFVDIERKGKPQGSWRRTHKPEVGGSIPLPATKNQGSFAVAIFFL